MRSEGRNRGDVKIHRVQLLFENDGFEKMFQVSISGILEGMIVLILFLLKGTEYQKERSVWFWNQI